MRFPPSFLDEIKARLPVSAVVGRRVKLVKAGREWKGLSPFNAEKTPSFYVNDQKGFYHDFSSGNHGNIFDFLIAIEGLTFRESVERLAEQAGLPLPTASPESEERERRRAGLHETLEWAATFFEASLAGAGGARARSYLADRGLSGAVQKGFRLGFAPDEKFALRDHLASKGASAEIMIEAGLLVHGDEIRVPYDRFRGRVMFPIADRAGRIIAFGGRALDPGVPAKYLNSPETTLFHKGSVLFNHHRARTAAHEKGTVIAVEGYVDVIAMTAAGFPHVVAPLGTALTPDQCELLWRMAPEPILCFDGDGAGRKAAYRAVDTALPLIGPGRSLRFAELPEGQDPDDLARSGGAQAIGEVIGRTRPLVDMLWTRETEAAPIDTPERRAALEHRLADLLRQIGDETVRRHYRADIDGRLATLMGRGPRQGARPGWAGRAGQGRPDQPRWRGPQGRGAPPGQRLGYVSAPSAVSSGFLQSPMLRPGSALPMREATILLISLNHPELLRRHAEEIASLEFGNRELSRFAGVLLSCAMEPDCDPATLRRSLDASGLQALRSRIEATDAVATLWCVRSEAALEDAEAALLQALILHRKMRALNDALRSAEVQLSAEETDTSFARLRDIRAEISALEGMEATIEGFGALSGSDTRDG